MKQIGIFFPIARMRKTSDDGKRFFLDDEERKRVSVAYNRNKAYYARLRDLIKEELGVGVKGIELSDDD